MWSRSAWEEERNRRRGENQELTTKDTKVTQRSSVSVLTLLMASGENKDSFEVARCLPIYLSS
jgi:hypothetical protein